MPGCPPLGDMHLLDQPQALLDHEDFLHHGVDRGVALLADADRRVDPATDRHALHLEGFGLDGDVQDLLLLVDLLVQAHPVGDDPLLVNDSRLLDDGNDLLVDKPRGPATMRHTLTPAAVEHRVGPSAHETLAGLGFAGASVRMAAAAPRTCYSAPRSAAALNFSPLPSSLAPPRCCPPQANRAPQHGGICRY